MGVRVREMKVWKAREAVCGDLGVQRKEERELLLYGRSVDGAQWL